MRNDLTEVASNMIRKFQELEAEYRSEALAGLRALERLDPETARLAIEAHGDRTMAALWLTDHVGSLCNERPWDYIARSEVGEVQRILIAIIYGLPA